MHDDAAVTAIRVVVVVLYCRAVPPLIIIKTETWICCGFFYLVQLWWVLDPPIKL
jgi:hypothetical protein